MSNKIKHFKTDIPWRSHSVLLCAFLISDQEHFMLFNCYQTKDLYWLAALQSYCIFTCHAKCWNSVFSFFDTDVLIFPHILPIQCMCVRYTHAAVCPSMSVKHNTIWTRKIWFYDLACFKCLLYLYLHHERSPLSLFVWRSERNNWLYTSSTVHFHVCESSIDIAIRD